MEPTIKHRKMNTMDSDQNKKASTSMETRNEILCITEYQLLKTLLRNRGITLNKAPRWCETTNLNMLKKFLEIEVDEHGLPIKDQADENGDQVKLKNKILFKDKNIFKEKEFNEHFGRYPVIYVNFKGVYGDSFEDVLRSFRFVLHDSFKKHLYLKKSKIWLEEGNDISEFIKYVDHAEYKTLTRKEIEKGLRYLSELLYKHFNKKVYVLIDAYSIPLSNASFNDCFSNDDLKKVIWLISDIIIVLLKDNKYVYDALMNPYHYCEFYYRMQTILHTILSYLKSFVNITVLHQKK
ncbi:hypothetical protein ACS0PU_007852 [Formica fusca]